MKQKENKCFLCRSRMPSVRGRELKHMKEEGASWSTKMPSVRGRELKHGWFISITNMNIDALRAGARIETVPLSLFCSAAVDALRAGARIETTEGTGWEPFETMPSVRGRELKLHLIYSKLYLGAMPSVRGRELKLTHLLVWKIDRMMPSVRGRELKLLRSPSHPYMHLMPSVRGRELKRIWKTILVSAICDALRAGARIETVATGASSRTAPRCPPCGGEN